MRTGSQSTKTFLASSGIIKSPSLFLKEPHLIKDLRIGLEAYYCTRILSHSYWGHIAFGIAPLEALNHDVPVLISRQSGVSEVLTHVLKADFWDVDEIANKIVAVLKYSPLEMTLKEYGNFEVRKLRWKESAQKCARIYAQTACV